jgi:glycosyltransferase involved in cell wall biosynthesis
MKNKKITIIGLIDNLGGREIEVRNIIFSLIKNYEVRVVSLFYMNRDSVAVKNLECNHTNIYREIYKANFYFKFLSILSKWLHKSKLPAYTFIDNKISRKFLNLKEDKLKILGAEIFNSDAILYCGVLEFHLLNDIINISRNFQKPLIIRTTGEIKKVNSELLQFLPEINKILVHSLNNTEVLESIIPSKIRIIDQTTLLQNELLKLTIKPVTSKLVFGYLGRLSEEKGIIALLEIFKKKDFSILVGGSGALKKDVLNLLNDNNNYLGEINSENITDFFQKIDVLIIPSFEESGPLVGIEAMAAGKIIFSTKVGAMMQRLSATKNNFWFDIHKEESLLELIEILQNLSVDKIKEIQELNRKVYLENYSLEIISKQYLNLFEDLINF